MLYNQRFHFTKGLVQMEISRSALIGQPARMAAFDPIEKPG